MRKRFISPSFLFCFTSFDQTGILRRKLYILQLIAFLFSGFWLTKANAQLIFTKAGGSAVGDYNPATSASLNTPPGVAVDGSGNLYIADFNNHRVRKVNASNGTISTVAGNGTASFAGDGCHFGFFQ